LKDVLKAYGYVTAGLKTSTGKRLMTADEIDANEVLLMALGFQPLEISRMRDKEFDKQRLGTMLSRRRGQVVQNFVKAYSEGEDTTDAMSALQEFNRKNPEFTIGGGDLRRGLKTWQMGDLGVESRREMLLQRRLGQ
jgi:nicotinic acid mononucleotide adenylyltransferase